MVQSGKEVSLIGAIEVVFEHITEAVCEEVFRQERTNERDRKWTLWLLVRFWVEVAMQAPAALVHALQECRNGTPGWPQVTASEQSFFQKSANLSPIFFEGVFKRFLESVLAQARQVYGRDQSSLGKKFSGILIIDGSKLSAVWKRLKVLRKIPNVILPGCLLGVYDYFRGIMRYLRYYGDAAKSELSTAVTALNDLGEGVKGALILVDRMYAKPCFTTVVTALGGFVLSRYNKTVKMHNQVEIGRRPHLGGLLFEFLVEVGGHGKTPAQSWRYIYWKKGSRHHRLITTILDPALLSAEEALALYPKRWSIERMFYDLKEVLNLNEIYCSNLNGVAQQVYAAAIVYNAFRIAQGRIGEELDVEPEAISMEKLFPHLAAVTQRYILCKWYFQLFLEANPGKKLNEPSMRNLVWAKVDANRIMLEKRSGKRKKKKFNPERAKWKSFAHFPKTKKMITD